MPDDFQFKKPQPPVLSFGDGPDGQPLVEFAPLAFEDPSFGKIAPPVFEDPSFGFRPQGYDRIDDIPGESQNADPFGIGGFLPPAFEDPSFG